MDKDTRLGCELLVLNVCATVVLYLMGYPVPCALNAAAAVFVGVVLLVTHRG